MSQSGGDTVILTLPHGDCAAAAERAAIYAGSIYASHYCDFAASRCYRAFRAAFVRLGDVRLEEVLNLHDSARSSGGVEGDARILPDALRRSTPSGSIYEVPRGALGGGNDLNRRQAPQSDDAAAFYADLDHALADTGALCLVDCHSYPAPSERFQPPIYKGVNGLVVLLNPECEVLQSADGAVRLDVRARLKAVAARLTRRWARNAAAVSDAAAAKWSVDVQRGVSPGEDPRGGNYIISRASYYCLPAALVELREGMPQDLLREGVDALASEMMTMGREWRATLGNRPCARHGVASVADEPAPLAPLRPDVPAPSRLTFPESVSVVAAAAAASYATAPACAAAAACTM